MNQSKSSTSPRGSRMLVFMILTSVCFVFFTQLVIPVGVSAQTPPYTKFMGYNPNGSPIYGLETTPAAGTPTTSATNISSLIAILQNIINAVIPFLIGLAIMLILYGILGYIAKAADEEKRKEAQAFILWGIMGVFVMVSVWGLVNILVGTFGFGSGNTPDVVTQVYKPADIPTGKLNTVVDLINLINAIGSRVIPFLIGIGFLILLIGIVNYIRQGDNEEKRAEGRMFIIWGIVSIFVMISIWGFVQLLVGTFGLNNIPALIPKTQCIGSGGTVVDCGTI